MKKTVLFLLCLGLVGCATTGITPQTRAAYVNANPQMSGDYKQDILQGKIAIGMTKEEVEASWGSLGVGNSSCSAYGCTETYGDASSQMLTFVDGKLTNIYNAYAQ